MLLSSAVITPRVRKVLSAQNLENCLEYNCLSRCALWMQEGKQGERASQALQVALLVNAASMQANQGQLQQVRPTSTLSPDQTLDLSLNSSARDCVSLLHVTVVTMSDCMSHCTSE